MSSQNSIKILKGVIPAIIVPLNRDRQLDIPRLKKQAHYLASSGVHGFFVNGSSGEGSWLSTEEKINVYHIVQGIKADNQFLCAACIQPSTEMVLKEIEIFAPLEPDFIVAVTPYYYTVSQDDILWHFKEIASQSPVPVIAYHIPQNTHNNMTLSTVMALTEIDNITGIKDSSGNFVNFSRACLSDVPRQFSWIQGEDYLDAPSLNIGADGMVTGLGNVFVQPYVEMYQAAQVGDYQKVNKMQKGINALYEIIQVTGVKVIPSIKVGASLLKRSQKWLKMGSQTLNDQEIEQVRKILTQLNLI